jgi:hypothetical protein
MTGGKPGFVAATKKAADIFRAGQIVPEAQDVGHFNKIRGLNTRKTVPGAW